mmetsp:Transcript_62373/g.182830  ORF Transcript_62373/g.182830 Transcript_62373/m.182830 type:complete len:233 (+) Transcript_62373:119-817(+)
MPLPLAGPSSSARGPAQTAWHCSGGTPMSSTLKSVRPTIFCPMCEHSMRNRALASSRGMPRPSHATWKPFPDMCPWLPLSKHLCQASQRPPNWSRSCARKPPRAAELSGSTSSKVTTPVSPQSSCHAPLALPENKQSSSTRQKLPQDTLPLMPGSIATRQAVAVVPCLCLSDTRSRSSLGMFDVKLEAWDLFDTRDREVPACEVSLVPAIAPPFLAWCALRGDDRGLVMTGW